MVLLNGAQLVPTDGKYGISTVKQVLHTILVARTELQTDLADGKLSFFEALGLLDNGRDFARLATSWRDIANEVRDLDDAEKEEVATYLVAEGLITNAESQIKWAIDTLVLIVRLLEQAALATKIFKK